MRQLRQQLKAILIVGEGPTEYAWLCFLKKIFGRRSSGKCITLQSGSGGGSVSVAEKAVRLCSNSNYDEAYILVDEDVGFNPSDSLHKKIQEYGLSVLFSSPCIEGLFLAIKNHNGRTWESVSSDECKRIFERDFLSSTDKMRPERYDTIFTSQELLERSKSIDILKRIIFLLAP